MSLVKIEGNASGTGTFTIAAPNSNTNRTLTLPDATGTIITTAGGAAISGTTGTFSGTISGGSTVGVGGATPSASGAGITFPATQSASSDANTLDDYEEGTFTVTDASGAGLTFTNNTARYTKIGRLVTVEIRNLSFPSTASGANVVLGGLPFTVGSTSDSIGACINNTGTTVIESLALNSSTTVYLYQGTSFTQIINSDLSLKAVYFTITYSV